MPIRIRFRVNEEAPMSQSLTGGEFEFYTKHFDRTDPRDLELRERAVEELAVRCPVAHSDAWGGYWLVSDYRILVSIWQDWETFSSVPEKHIVPRPLNRPAMAPIDVDPPIQREYRHMLNPYLAPRRIAQFEPGIRMLVSDLIDEFIEEGHCDLASQFAWPFPGKMLYRFLLGLDDAEVEMVQSWTQQTTFNPGGPETPVFQQRWNSWVYEVIERRRNEPRKDDIIDALLHAEFDGVSPSDEAIAGCIEILILGGFATTTDSMLNTMFRLAQDQELQGRLRSDPSLIPGALDEFLRFDPPVPGMDRICTRDTVVGGKKIKAGERIWGFYAAANRDPAEFDRPNHLDVERERNRHVSFGVGLHRCIGSNVARLNLRIALEELLSRFGQFAITPGDAVQRTWKGIAYLPLSFTPSPRAMSTK
jgi:cytochrome P450